MRHTDVLDDALIAPAALSFVSSGNPQSEKYLDQIMVFRFYFRCSKCGAEMSMKTDPKNSDYVMEQGATRNHEPWRDKDKVRRPPAVHFIALSRLLALPDALTTIHVSSDGCLLVSLRLQSGAGRPRQSAPPLAESQP